MIMNHNTTKGMMRSVIPNQDARYIARHFEMINRQKNGFTAEISNDFSQAHAYSIGNKSAVNESLCRNVGRRHGNMVDMEMLLDGLVKFQNFNRTDLQSIMISNHANTTDSTVNRMPEEFAL